MKKTKIIFLVLPRTHLLDLAGPDQAFREAIDLGASLELVYCSAGNTITASNNLGINKLKNFAKIKPAKGDYIFIAGAQLKYLVSGKIPFEKEMIQWLKEAYNAGAFICSVCTGAFFLAKTGLLNGKKATTHWKHTKELKQEFPAVNLYEDILYTQDERIFTSAGVTAGIDLALFILSRLVNESFSFKVAKELVVYMRRAGNEQQQTVFTQYRNHIHTGIHKVQEYVQDNISKTLTIDALANISCMSTRNFTRVFKKETGITVNGYIALIRKEKLERLSANPEVTRKQMAALCGLKSERHVIRLLNNKS